MQYSGLAVGLRNLRPRFDSQPCIIYIYEVRKGHTIHMGPNVLVTRYTIWYILAPDAALPCGSRKNAPLRYMNTYEL